VPHRGDLDMSNADTIVGHPSKSGSDDDETHHSESGSYDDETSGFWSINHTLKEIGKK